MDDHKLDKLKRLWEEVAKDEWGSHYAAISEFETLKAEMPPAQGYVDAVGRVWRSAFVYGALFEHARLQNMTLEQRFREIRGDYESKA